MCRLRNIALGGDRRTDRQTDGRTDRQTTDKVIPMCRYASQATQKCHLRFKDVNFICQTRVTDWQTDMTQTRCPQIPFKGL